MLHSLARDLCFVVARIGEADREYLVRGERRTRDGGLIPIPLDRVAGMESHQEGHGGVDEDVVGTLGQCVRRLSDRNLGRNRARIFGADGLAGKTKKERGDQGEAGKGTCGWEDQRK